MVVVSIIAIMAAVAYGSLTKSQQQSRDAKRQSDLRLVENAVELFKNKYGHYPSGCNASSTGPVPIWSGETGTGSARECSTGNQYIINLAPEFIPELPRDPRAGAGGNDSGYVYAVNDDGSVYKFMAWRSVEAETLTSNPPDGEQHEFFRCGGNYDTSVTLCAIETAADCIPTHLEACEYTPASVSATAISASSQDGFDECTVAANYESTYAVSGGFSRENTNNDFAVEYLTERLRCR